jgi:hypothetical protein
MKMKWMGRTERRAKGSKSVTGLEQAVTSASRLAMVAMLGAMCVPGIMFAQQKGEKTFSSPEAASRALMDAAEKNDASALISILGPEGKQIVSSGDDAEDAEARANFAQHYQEMHRLVAEGDGMTVLYIGSQNWPYPIPLLHKGNVWFFDTESGKKEILYRRVGRNEISAIHICQELVTAQKEYATQHNGEYAQKIFSDEGQKNGLYWKSAEGEPQSPIGPLVASAATSGFAKSQNGEPTPYRGYYFHILTADGSKSYITDGKMTGGFAFVAYPAEYRSSGVMTFIVNQDGVIYQKDLGKKTEDTAKSLKTYDPRAGWDKTEELPEEAANTMGK